MAQPAASLQLILPTDKRNPSFTLYLTEDRRFLHVYYGLERLEVIPAAADHPAHPMLVGRLYNADVKVSALEELFDLDHKTIRAWGLALDSGDPEALQRMLFGPARKLTAPIREFIARRWPQLRAEGYRNHREVLQNEIKAYFGVSLSGESLRLMMNQITGGLAGTATQIPAAPEVSPPADTLPDTLPDPVSSGGEVTPECDLFAPVQAPPRPPDEAAQSCDELPAKENSDSFFHEVVEVLPDPGFRESACFSEAGFGTEETPSEVPEIPDSTGFGGDLHDGGEPPVPDWFESKFDPSPWQPEPGEATLCDHVGVMVFAAALASLPAVVDPPQPILSQWLASIPLGAHNIEQTQLLNWSDLSLLLGSTVSFPAPQREMLGKLATPPNRRCGTALEFPTTRRARHAG